MIEALEGRTSESSRLDILLVFLDNMSNGERLLKSILGSVGENGRLIWLGTWVFGFGGFGGALGSILLVQNSRGVVVSAYLLPRTRLRVRPVLQGL